MHGAQRHQQWAWNKQLPKQVEIFQYEFYAAAVAIIIISFYIFFSVWFRYALISIYAMRVDQAWFDGFAPFFALHFVYFSCHSEAHTHISIF